MSKGAKLMNFNKASRELFFCFNFKHLHMSSSPFMRAVFGKQRATTLNVNKKYIDKGIL